MTRDRMSIIVLR